jgi:hypothetical protein
MLMNQTISKKAPKNAPKRAPKKATKAQKKTWGYFPDEKRAILRPDGEKGSAELTVSFAERTLPTTLKKGDSLLFAGECAPRIVIDGRETPFAGDWEEVCWISDEDADYLEIDIALDVPVGAPVVSSWSLQRQMLLARDDQFLFIADAVLAPGSSRIEYQLPLPLPAKGAFAPERETREGWLGAGRVMPLALPEWRSDADPSSLAERDGRLVLSQAQAGCRLFAPLFIDLHPRRPKLDATWRRLTVGKGLAIEPVDAAVGYRVQVGARQWLFYRSLAEEDSRTVLGHNLTTEFLAARFSTSGGVDKLVEVENE